MSNAAYYYYVAKSLEKHTHQLSYICVLFETNRQHLLTHEHLNCLETINQKLDERIRKHLNQEDVCKKINMQMVCLKQIIKHIETGESKNLPSYHLTCLCTLKEEMDDQFRAVMNKLASTSCQLEENLCDLV